MKSMERSLYPVLLTILLTALAGSAFARSTDDYLKSARQYLDSGELNKAVIESKNALQKDPDNGEVRLLLGQVYLRLGQAAAAGS